MTVTNHYNVSQLVEAQHQPGSRGRVLRNLLGISGKRLMDEVEAREQKRALQEKKWGQVLKYKFSVETLLILDTGLRNIMP
jgi:hypothetical protein